MVLVLVGILTIGAASAIDSAFEDSGQIQEIDGETVNTGGVGTIETLEQSNVGAAIYGDRPTITNGSGIIMNQGDDYTWFTSNGTFRIESSNLANDNGVAVDYSYTVPNQNQEQLASLYGNFLGAMAPIMFMFLIVTGIVAAMVRFAT